MVIDVYLFYFIKVKQLYPLAFIETISYRVSDWSYYS